MLKFGCCCFEYIPIASIGDEWLKSVSKWLWLMKSLSSRWTRKLLGKRDTRTSSKLIIGSTCTTKLRTHESLKSEFCTRMILCPENVFLYIVNSRNTMEVLSQNFWHSITRCVQQFLRGILLLDSLSPPRKWRAVSFLPSSYNFSPSFNFPKYTQIVCALSFLLLIEMPRVFARVTLKIWASNNNWITEGEGNWLLLYLNQWTTELRGSALTLAKSIFLSSSSSISPITALFIENVLN